MDLAQSLVIRIWVESSGFQVSGFLGLLGLGFGFTIQGAGFLGTYSHELHELAPKSTLLSAPWVQLRHIGLKECMN